MYEIEDSLFRVKLILDIAERKIVSGTFVMYTNEIFMTYVEGAGLDANESVNDDKTIKSFFEGLAVWSGGGSWAVEESNNDPDIPKLLFKIDLDVVMEEVAVAFQRAWKDLANALIGFYDAVDRSWSFMYYVGGSVFLILRRLVIAHI